MSADQKIIDQLDKKYSDLDQNLNTHLEGLLHSKPIDYSILRKLTPWHDRPYTAV